MKTQNTQGMGSSEPCCGLAGSLTVAAGSLPTACLLQTLTICPWVVVPVSPRHSHQLQPLPPPSMLWIYCLKPFSDSPLSLPKVQAPHSVPGPPHPLWAQLSCWLPSLQTPAAPLLTAPPQTSSTYSHLPPSHLLVPTAWAFLPETPVSVLDLSLVPYTPLPNTPHPRAPGQAWPQTALCCPLLAASGLAGHTGLCNLSQ